MLRHILFPVIPNLPTEIISIDSEEALMETIAYIDRNSIMAGYKYLPCDYPWGSARYMFREMSHVKCASYQGVSTQSLSVRDVEEIEVSDLQTVEYRSLVRSRKQIPPDWVIDQYGMIMPYCFLSVDTLKRLFVSPLRYLYFLSRKLEGKIDLQQGIKAFIPDKEMRVITARLSKEIFATDCVKSLDFESKIVLARKLRYQYASTPKQISRMLSLDVATLSEFI